MVCCYKYHPKYLTPARCDVLMDLVVYDEGSVGVKVVALGVV